MTTANYVKDWRRKTKARIIEAMGGKCVSCDYNRYQEVFDLHHLNPLKKNFSFGSIRANPKAWSTIVIELRKCVLLCANCHREVEAGYKTVENIQYFNEQYVNPFHFNRGLKPYKSRICKSCKEEYDPTGSTQKYCSPLCRKRGVS